MSVPGVAVRGGGLVVRTKEGEEKCQQNRKYPATIYFSVMIGSFMLSLNKILQ